MSEAAEPALSVRIAEGPVVYLPREELGLVDFVVVLVRRWPWFIAGFAMALMVTGWWLSRSPVRYESRGVVKIGHSRVSFPIIPTKEQQDVLLEAPPTAARRVSQAYGANSPLGQKFGGSFVSGTAFEKGADELLTITARGPSPEAARDFLDAVLTEFVEGHRRLYSSEREVMEQRLTAIAEERKRIEREIAHLDVVKLEESPAMLVVRQLTRAQFLQQELPLEQEAVRLRREILNLQSPPTQLIAEPVLNPGAVEPRRTMTWCLGILLGAALGCGLAFSVELLGHVARRLRTGN